MSNPIVTTVSMMALPPAQLAIITAGGEESRPRHQKRSGSFRAPNSEKRTFSSTGVSSRSEPAQTLSPHGFGAASCMHRRPSAAEFPTEDRPEPLPTLAAETHHLELLDG